jgi:hypothetical protein
MDHHHTLSAFTEEPDAAAAARELSAQLGSEARAVVFFCSRHHDGALLSRALRERIPGAEVIGCTTAGAFVETRGAKAGVSAFRLPAAKVARCAGGLARFDGGVDAGIRAAAARMSAAMGAPLDTLDPARHVGLVLLEGLKGNEESANFALGGVAPQLSFVGGSAGDDCEFRETRVFYNGEVSDDGGALLVLEARVPFTVLKTCSFAPTERTFEVTRADARTRTVYELDHRPAPEVYAEAVGVEVGALDSAVFTEHPCGLMLDGEPWIRSPQRVMPDGGLRFYCAVEEGMILHLMRSTDLLADTRAAVRRVARSVGGEIGGALLFNCVLRKVEIEGAHAEGSFLELLSGFPVAGFHTYGESWLGHINQTCTGLVLG